MKKNYEYISRLFVASLIATMLLGFLQLRFAYAQETLDTDYALYTFQWKLGGVDQSRPYVNVTLTAAGLDPTHMYKIRVWKYGPTPGPSGESHAISAVTSTIVYFLLQDIPQNLAGTYNASLYDETLARTVAKTNFGVWGLSGPGYNYGQTMLVWGGGALNGTDVTIRIYNATHDVTSLLLDDDTTTAGDYGEFTFMAKEPFSYPKYTGTYNVTIDTFTPIVDLRPIQDTTQMQVSNTLRVRVYTDKNEYERLETVYVTAEVYHLDWSPVIGGKVQAKFYNGTIAPKNLVKTIDLTRTIAGNYSGSWEMPYNAKIGVWYVHVNATEPPYGNTGTDSTIITIKVTTLVVAITKQPPTVVNRASVVTMTFTVKYPDGSTATLDLTQCRVVVVNATTKAVVAIPTLTRVAAGTYNASWYVPPYAPIGSTYQFLISRNNLTDNVKPDPNIGPVEDIYSIVFAVERAPIDVFVSTHDPVTWASKTVFAKTDTVGIRAKVVYHNGPPMATGTVTASIEYPNGTIAAKKLMTWDPAKYNWYVVYALPAGAPSGTWRIEVDAQDGANNFGNGNTTFFVAGVELQPLSGTVGPTTTVDDYGVVSGSVYSIGTKSLGTVVRVNGLGLPPNKSVNITVTITTYHWYQAKYGTYDLLVLRNVPTNEVGAFSATFTFPTAPAGKYTIKAKVGAIVYETAEFEVVRGILLDPQIMAGPMVVKVIGTGFKPSLIETIRGILVNETDAIMGYNLQSWIWQSWAGDGNGTLRSNIGTSAQPYYVQPGFTFPVLVTGTYKITLVSADATGTFYKIEDTIKVVSELKQLMEELKNLGLRLDNINATLIRVGGNITTIQTRVGEIYTKVEEIAKMKDIIISINGTVGYIKTDVGTIRGWASDIQYIRTEVAKIQGIKDNTDGLPSKIDEVKNLSMPIYIAVILSLIAAIAAIICAVLIYRKIA